MNKHIDFRPLENAHLDLLAHWRLADHIRPWFGDGNNQAEIVAQYATYLQADSTKAGHLIFVAGQPIGFVESYLAKDRPRYFANLDLYDPGGVGMDIFIGEPAALGQGLGSRVIRSFVRQLLFANETISACYVAPDERNQRSIRAFENAGFRYLHTVQVPGDDAPARVLECRKEG